MRLSDVRSAPPDGAALLDLVEAFVRKYLVLPSERDYVAVVLWTGHTWLSDGFSVTPRLAFLSPEPGSGKTRAQDVLVLLVPRPVRVFSVSVPVLFRSMVDEGGRPVAPPTLFLDEVDALFGAKTKGDDEPLRAFLNAGFDRGAIVQRIGTYGQRMVIESFPAFAPVCLAGLRDLPQTLTDRSIVIAMRRKTPDEKVSRFRVKWAEPAARELRAGLEAWAATVDRAALDLPEDAIPAGLDNRLADRWEVLLAVAMAAGGAWPERARAAAVEFAGAGGGPAESTGVRLLADLKVVFDAARDDGTLFGGDVAGMSTAEILKQLFRLEESPWGDPRWPLDARGLAKLLKPYAVESRTIRLGPDTAKGYRRADLIDPWTRYLNHQQDQS